MPRSRALTALTQRTLARILPALLARVERMPRPRALALGARLGRLAYRLAGRTRATTLSNLRLAFPELDASAREALARRCFEHWGKVSMDFLKGPSYDRAALDAMVPVLDGYAQNAVPALDAGAGIVAVTAHLGAFELFGRYVGTHGIPMVVVARDPRDPAFGAAVRRLRESGGYRTVDSNGGLALRELLKALRRGEVVGILPDQNAGDVFAPFFGIPAGVADGAALLAYKTGAALIPAFCVLMPDDTYRIVVRPAIPVDRAADRAAEVERVTRLFTREIEDAVRAWPEQYLWLHNRWKSAFEEKNRARWPEGYDFDALRARWRERG